MKVDVPHVRQLLSKLDFKTLFREQIGWDKHQAQLEIQLGGKTFTLTAVAEKRGFQVFTCPVIPDRATRLKLDRQVTKSAREHLIIYVDATREEQLWEWVRREPGKPAASRDYRFNAGQSGDALIQKLGALAIALDEEEKLTIVDVTGKVKAALDVDKVTKKFYDRFKAEHAVFLKFIKGIKQDADLQWYTSLMLNRLMFVYFIQKKGFLDGDVDYLRNRLARMRQQHGKDKFYSFYRYFLLRLFHEGLGQAPQERQPELDKLLGKVPFLNGGFFEVHDLERKYPAIDIPDAAFEKLFEFFDAYRWHLDERPLRADNEINPDVVGYIFEKYINQKQMGAYYTKEDITEYISKNTIIPFVFDAAEKKCAIAFRPDSALWRLLRDDPDRYIYAAVRHGVVRDDGVVVPESELPDFVQVGMHDPNARMFDKRFNLQQAPADDPLRLVTETWREYMHRRQRCLDIRAKLGRGEVHQINDLITLNLDIWQFARDAIINAEGPELLRAFYRVLAGHIPARSNERYERGLSVLDPTCGSGAFLFAALRILETLYSDCLERMRGFVDDVEERGGRAGRAGGRAVQKYADFRAVLDEVGRHPNERYYVLKSIIISNLFGVDIMQEAVEIAKLRLFLKLVAQVETADQIEPLPDIDFNIRAGNTLVGYASAAGARQAFESRPAGQIRQGALLLPDDAAEYRQFEDELDLVERAFQQFRQQQTVHGGQVTSADKRALRERLARLDDVLDRHLAGEYGITVDKAREFAAWKGSHQPFHWFVEFFGIMRDGGFDVIIGNPPYVSAAKARRAYSVRAYRTDECTDIYAWCLERVSQLAHDHAYTGMIVPLSLTFSGDFARLRSLLYTAYGTNWFSSYGRIPAALFAHDVRVRNTIHLGAKRGDGRQYTTRLHRWFDSERSHLLTVLSYAPFDPSKWAGRVPKLNTAALIAAFESAASRGRRLEQVLAGRPTEFTLHFKKTAYNWLNFCRELPPCYDDRGRPIPHTKFGQVFFTEPKVQDAAFLMLNGKVEFAFWVAIGDDFDVTRWMFGELPVDLAGLPGAEYEPLAALAGELDAAMRDAVSFKLNAGKRVGNYNLARCRHVTDKSDRLLARVCGFDAVWEDVELLYTQCVRTDFGDGSDEGDDE